jgi:hypothetical protein
LVNVYTTPTHRRGKSELGSDRLVKASQYCSVMFFEAPAAGEVPPRPDFPELPTWAFPPDQEVGAVVAIDRVVARSANVVIVLPFARVFSTGCMLTVETALRQGDLTAEAWWDLHMSGHIGFPYESRGEPPPDRLLRLGVRYPDGTKLTTLREPPTARGQEPEGPVLTLTPASSGSRGWGSMFQSLGLWLWPLPPAETFEFAVQWPVGGIVETIVELDGAVIAGASARSQLYWPTQGTVD